MRGLSNPGVFIWLTALAATLPAQSGADLEASLTPVTACSRIGAPVAVDVRLTWHGKGLLRGRLEIVVTDGAATLGRVRTRELVVSDEPLEVRLLLPAVTTATAGKQTSAAFRFHTAHGTRALGRRAIRIPRFGCPGFVVAVCRAAGSVDRMLDAVGRSLFLERYVPAYGFPPPADPGGGSTRSRLLESTLARLEHEDLPESPLDYCAFDVVLLRAEAFRPLREKQLRALGEWVEAGGSLCLLVDRLTGLTPHHLALLNRLGKATGFEYAVTPPGGVTVTDPTGAVHALDRSESTPAGPEAAPLVLRLRAELGRAVIVHGALDVHRDLNGKIWRRAVAHLWKVRRERLAGFDPGSRRRRGWRRGSGPWILPGVFADGPDDVPDPAEPFLPSRLRVVPYGLFLLILGAFILVIGPGDYALARLLRRGWLTWIVFPLVCAGFTHLMIRVSRHYLGGDHRRSLILVDLGAGGRELRRSRIEAQFLGEERVLEREMRRVLVAPIASRVIGTKRAVARPVLAGAAGPVRIEGRYPGHYRLRQRIRQWTPAFTRFLGIAPGPAPPVIDWERVDEEVGSGQVRYEWWPKAVRAHPVHIEFFEGRLGWDDLYSDWRPLPPEADGDGRDAAMTGARWFTLLQFVRGLSVRGDGLFALTQRMSPSGSGRLEDLALADPGDEDQRLLVILTVDENGDYIAYRRLYAGVRPGGGAGR